MAGAGVSGSSPDAAAGGAVEAYLATLAGALRFGPASQRAAIVAEIRDGLHEAVAVHTACGLPPDAAAAAAVGEFGDPLDTARGFASELAAGSARRVGYGLLLTGPLVGLTWLGTLARSVIAVDQLPPGLGAAAALFAVVLIVAVPAAILAIAAAGRLSRWLPSDATIGAATVAAVACVVGDAGLLAGLGAWLVASIVGAGSPAWGVVALAGGGSLTRLVLVGRVARRCLAIRANLA
jgi:hypothetical protein